MLHAVTATNVLNVVSEKGVFTVTNSCKAPESGGVNEWS